MNPPPPLSTPYPRKPSLPPLLQRRHHLRGARLLRTRKPSPPPRKPSPPLVQGRHHLRGARPSVPYIPSEGSSQQPCLPHPLSP